MILFALDSYLNIINIVFTILFLIMTLIVLHFAIIAIAGIFTKKKYPESNVFNRYGCIIPARNEENTVADLITSIRKTKYPQDKLDIFVIAHNCTDNTAKIAREHGAICYERFDDAHRTKGYALEFLFDRIEEDYGRMSFEGYFIFDADNLLKSDYITKMNDAFDSGEKIITSYRNTKNFDENWIASTYALHWIRSIRYNHRARSVLRLATNIQGTGFLFTNEIVKNGWHYTSLTEDRALTADAVAQGYQITYQNDAMFYDEQPISLKVALRQRTRWAKGHLQAFVESGPYLFINVFLGKWYVRTKWGENSVNKKRKSKTFKEFILNIIENIRHRFASYDTLMQLTPFNIFNIARWLIVIVVMYGCYCYNVGVLDVNIFGGGTYLAQALRHFFTIKVTMNPGINALFAGMLLSIWLRILFRLGMYIENMAKAVYLFIVEHKNIKKMSIWKKMLYTFTWPTFDIIGRYAMYAALFMHVEWKPIPHESKITIDDINAN